MQRLRLFLSTLSLRRATGRRITRKITLTISIHALLAESDANTGEHLEIIKIFLSTLSLRRATNPKVKLSLTIMDFYPRSPCGERLNQDIAHRERQKISIHALLAESDCRPRWQAQAQKDTFLSTLSLRRATAPNQRPCPRSKISIHALLAESDCDRWV